ncbi:hypothetical protein WJX81_006263 [Elliptochloris bilobata]|uniref:Uncharacterized protein n=1 Tax=Elliptochloris bilobata TaxID=381761 RepID=A0AAW1QMW6_9CHLO
MKKFGMNKILDAFGHQPPTTLELNDYPDFLTKVEIEGSCESGPRNMAVVDILRDRERGMVHYNQARRQYGLKALADFEDISDDPKVVEAIKSVYNNIEDVDYMVGCLAESSRPKGRPTMLTTTRHSAWRNVDGTTFKSLLMRHYPELEDSIGDILGGNAFYAWKGAPKYGGFAHVCPNGIIWDKIDWMAEAFGLAPWYA